MKIDPKQYNIYSSDRYFETMKTSDRRFASTKEIRNWKNYKFLPLLNKNTKDKMSSKFQRSAMFLAGIRSLMAKKEAGELVSPGMWTILNLYRNVFAKFSMMPFSFDLSERVIHVDRLTRGKRFVSKCWSVLGPIHSLFCFYLLSNMLSRRKFKSDDVLTVLRPVACMYLGLIPLALTGMSYTISFCPQVAPMIVNCIPKLEKKIMGELIKLICQEETWTSKCKVEIWIYTHLDRKNCCLQNVEKQIC